MQPRRLATPRAALAAPRRVCRVSGRSLRPCTSSAAARLRRPQRGSLLLARARLAGSSDDEGDDDDWGGEDDPDPVLDLSDGFTDEDSDEEGAPSDDDDVNPDDWMDLVDDGDEGSSSGDGFDDDDDDAEGAEQPRAASSGVGGAGGKEDDVDPAIMAAMGHVRRPIGDAAGDDEDGGPNADVSDDADGPDPEWDEELAGELEEMDDDEQVQERMKELEAFKAEDLEAPTFEDLKAQARARMERGEPPLAAASDAPSTSGAAEEQPAPAPAPAPATDAGAFDIDSLIAAGSNEDGGKIDKILERIGVRDTAEAQPVEFVPPSPPAEYPPLPERSLTFGELLTKCGYDDEVLAQYSNALDVEITGISNFADQVEEGHLFVCESGAFYDGHEHISAAIERGAVLIVARLQLPGAELAMCIDSEDEDFDPRSPQFEGLYSGDSIYGLADNDAKTVAKAQESIENSYEHLEEFAAANGIDARTKEHMQTVGAARIASAALEYDITHWDDPKKGLGTDDHLPTPHPFNHMVNVELDVPVLFAIDPRDFCAVLVNAFYDRPSERMTTVTVTGEIGKTTVAWLIRSILEQHDRVTGLVSTVEDAIAADRLTPRGDVWESEVPDPTLMRESTAPFCAAPYQGKYEKDHTTPDHVAMQQLLASMADRGAEAAVVEASMLGVARGGLEWVAPKVAVMTPISGATLGHYEEHPVSEYTRVFQALQDPYTQRAVLNVDDPLEPLMRGSAFPARQDEAQALCAERIVAVARSTNKPDSEDDDSDDMTDGELDALPEARGVDSGEEDSDAHANTDTDEASSDDDLTAALGTTAVAVADGAASEVDASDTDGGATDSDGGALDLEGGASDAEDDESDSSDAEPGPPLPPMAYEEVPLAPYVSYSMSNSNADVYPLHIAYSIWETELLVQTPRGSLELATPLIGKFNAAHTLACIAAAIALEIPLQTIVDTLGNAELVPGRCEIIDEGQQFQVLVDAADTPERLRALLSALRACADCKRIILVFGCDGDGPREERPVMGAIADELADVVILTNDSPGAALPQDIISDVIKGFCDAVRNAFPGEPVSFLQDVGRVEPLFEDDLLESQGEVRRHVIEDRFCAVRAAISIGQPNDVVVIAGKGAQDYQTNQNVAGEVFRGWFDDRVEARNALSKLPALEAIPYLSRKNLPWTNTQT